MHPDQEERLSHVEEEEEEAQQEEGVFGSSCPTPHEALSLSWPDDHLTQETPSRPASPTPLLDHPQSEDHSGALDALPPALPLLPPLETAPLGGPLTRSFSNYLQDDSKFFRPVAGHGPLKPAAAAVTASAPKPVRRILPVSVPSSSTTTSRFKRPRAESVASASAPAPPPAPAPVLAAAAPAPRKKRRGMRPGTYMCLYKGELYECPHGCDIVEKGLLYDLLRR
jgi:hypothetical protein